MKRLPAQLADCFRPAMASRMACAVIVALFVPLMLGAQPPAATAATATDELVGLWKAKRWFGPDARGLLVIQRAASAYTADVAGHVVPVRLEGGELRFDLPNGQGTFRGKLEPGGEILGHWYPPRALGMADVYVSPVRLRVDRPNRWSGQIVPFEDVFTCYLLLQKRPDGSMGALMRNIERDWGMQIGVERLTLDGNVVTLRGKRAGQEEREIASGTWDPETQMISLVFPNRGGTYDFRRDGDESDFYPRGKNPAPYVYHPPTVIDDGWPTGSLEDAGIDRAVLERFVQTIIDTPMDSADAPQIHAVLIARHGQLVLEEYFHGERRDKLHETRSAAKSMTSTIVGAAIHAGAPLALSTPLYRIMNGGEFPENLDPQKKAITLEHLLTMTSGHFCDDNNPNAPANEDAMWDQTDEPDFYRITMRAPMDRRPGDKAVYCSSDPNLALGVVGRAAGESPLYVFDRLVGEPMRINTYGWLTDPAGNPYGGGGVKFLPRDFMKLGQLMLNGGTWRGRRILGRDFVKRATTPLYQLGSRRYGYLWWSSDQPYEESAVHTFAALGAGGQSVTVVPELDLVIACFGGSYSSQGWRWFSPQMILSAVSRAASAK